MSGAWGMRSVGQQLMNSIHTVIRKLYVAIVTYSFILWEHVREQRGQGQVTWSQRSEDNVRSEWRGVDSQVS